MDLVALKVKIGLRPNGHEDHPDFNQIDSEIETRLNEIDLIPPADMTPEIEAERTTIMGQRIRKGMDWSYYIDKHGMGWHYDKSCGHKEHRVEAKTDTDSPMGMQWGILMVPKDFADAAMIKFPAVCSKLTEAQLTDWYDKRCHAHESNEKVSIHILEVIKAKEDAGATLTAEDIAARDPNDPTPGITKNRNKHYVDFKADRKIRIVQ